MPHIIHPSRTIDWAIQTSRSSHAEVYWSRRLMVVRIFARHLAAMDPATEVPPRTCCRTTTAGSLDRSPDRTAIVAACANQTKSGSDRWEHQPAAL